jgi:glycosyltransferase involved in cell wall biosynthesis
MIDPSLFSPPYDEALVQALKDTGLNVEIYTRDPRKGEKQISESLLSPFRFFRFSEKLLRMNFGKIAKIIKSFEYIFDFTRFTILKRGNVIHVQWLILPIFEMFAWRIYKFIHPNTKLVLTLHDSKPFLGATSSFVQKIGYLNAAKAFDQFIVHTLEAKEIWNSRGLKNINVIPHGILHVNKTPIEFTQKNNNAEINEILFFGLIKHYKGLDILIEAWGIIDKVYKKNWKLKIAGNPVDDISKIKSRCKELNIEDEIIWDLRFIPEEELHSIFSSASCFVFPYREIDASGAFLSIIPYLKPIIATDVGLFKDLLVNNENGLLVEKENPIELATALQKVMSDNNIIQSISINLKSIYENLQWNNIAKQTLKIYLYF